MQSFRFMAKEHHRFYQIKSRIQADANIRLFSRSMIKMIVINSQTSWSSISPCSLLWPIYLEIIYIEFRHESTKRWKFYARNHFWCCLSKNTWPNFIVTHWFFAKICSSYFKIDRDTISKKISPSMRLIYYPKTL